VHGEHAVNAAEEVSGLLFGGREPQSLSADALRALALEIPVFTVEPKDAYTTYDVLEATFVGQDALFSSKADMRRMLQQGGVYLNGRRLGPERDPLKKEDLLGGEYVLVRKGAKSYGLVKMK
jgi:tyrosyl-tRNA synthetase